MGNSRVAERTLNLIKMSIVPSIENGTGDLQFSGI